jgi:hypothetical protein
MDIRQQTKSSLQRFLNGYKKFNKLAASEKRKRLAQMTTEDSLREYRYLCSLYAFVEDKEFSALEHRKIAFLKKRRQILNKIGRRVKKDR